MHGEVIAQVIGECRDKADAYLRCAEALAKLLPEPDRPTPPPSVVQQPRSTRRVFGSQADYQSATLAVLAQAESGLGIKALAMQTGIPRTSLSTALRELQASGQVQKLGDYKTAIYRAGPRPAQGVA